MELIMWPDLAGPWPCEAEAPDKLTKQADTPSAQPRSLCPPPPPPLTVGSRVNQIPDSGTFNKLVRAPAF
jgi:hypothetical protein